MKCLLFSDVCVCCVFVVVSPQRPANNDGVSGKTASSLFGAFMSQFTFPNDFLFVVVSSELIGSF